MNVSLPSYRNIICRWRFVGKYPHTCLKIKNKLSKYTLILHGSLTVIEPWIPNLETQCEKSFSLQPEKPIKLRTSFHS